MNSRPLPLAVWIIACALGQVWGADAPPVVLAPLKTDAARARAMAWAAERGVQDAEVLAALQQVWSSAPPDASAEDLLDRTIQCFSLVDPATRELAGQLLQPQAPLVPPSAQPLLMDGQSSYYAANLRAYVGRYLTQRDLFDEALEMFRPAVVKDLVDPAGFLFYKACCEKRLLLKDDGLATIDQLLKSTEGVPVRYSTVATLMRYDLEALRDKSLDEISWKMEDVERRLKLARAGEKVQKVEDEIVQTLDEIIKKIEEQMGGGGGGGGGDGQNQSNQSSAPAGDSQVKGATAPGEVDKKKLKNAGEWGNLNEKERAKVEDLISRDFPAHYHKAIEEYFRKAADRKAPRK